MKTYTGSKLFNGAIGFILGSGLYFLYSQIPNHALIAGAVIGFAFYHFAETSMTIKK